MNVRLVLIFYVNYSLINAVPEVRISPGKISGYYKSSVEGRTFSAFEGIPYAQPPVGDLRFEIDTFNQSIRFKAPQPASPWNSTLNATTLYVCKQTESVFSTLDRYNNEHEDCLYLNVYVPNEQPSENDNFDVIVNFHGGSFMYGDGDMAPPDHLLDRNVVYVNLNYRVGILGFLSTEDTIVPGNNGLKDQQLALKWVQAHIKQFGGNPKSVTLLGESSGAASVHFHYFSPGSQRLFHRGISLSGNALMPWSIQKGALRKANKLAALLNCTYSKTKDMVDCLKVIPVDEIISKTSDFYNIPHHPIVPFAPVIETKSDHSFITNHPYRLLEEGKINQVPWLSWITGNEGLLFTATHLPGSFEEIDKNWDEWSPYLLSFGYDVDGDSKRKAARQIKSFYLQDESFSQNNVQKYGKLMGDRNFNVGFEIAATMQAKVSKSSVYAGVYDFNATRSNTKAMGLDLKSATHGDGIELIYGVMFATGAGDKKLPQSDRLMKESILDLLTSFASDGKPKAKEVRWEPVTSEIFNYLLIRNIDDMNMVQDFEFSPKEFWEKLDN